MIKNEDMFQNKASIYKFAFESQKVHRNVMRKKLVGKGKIASKNKFAATLDQMIKEGVLVQVGEEVSVNPDVVKIGAVQKNGEEYHVVTPGTKKRFKINKSVASGYRSGDVVDVVFEKFGEETRAIILGKSKKEYNASKEKEKKADLPEEKGSRVLGRVVKTSHDNLVFIPNRKNFEIRQIPILNRKEEFASFQDKICIMNLTNVDAPLLGGYIVEVKGDAGNPIHEYDAIAESHGAIMSWEGEQLRKEIEQIPTKVDVSSLNLIEESDAKYLQKGSVVDLRHLPFVTVDPATCKDMDDAIYSTFDQNGDFVTYTAVANVTKYVKLDSEIGRRYLSGAFTIYAPNKAYSILPNQLSTGICSLNPKEDRLAFVVKTVIDKNSGKVKDSKIYDAIIQSKQKYSYEQAQEIVDGLESDTSKQRLMAKYYMGQDLSLEEQILMNYYSAQAIKNGFERRRMIRFVSNKEREVLFDEGLQQVVDIKPVKHLYYHEVIEAFMVTANEATAKYAKDKNLSNIFRVHDEPNPRKVERANEFFEILGIDFDGDLSAAGTRALIEMIRNTANEEIINKFLIKMQSRAVYSNRLYAEKDDEEEVPEWVGERVSHYALQSPHYSHTTSPIRRLPDYFTQYNILANMHGTKPLSADVINKAIEIANDRQLEVDQAEKDFDDINSVLYCEQHIGETMSGRVTKIRYTSAEDGYEDNIVAIVKNEERGIVVEVPLSQIIGRKDTDCELSAQRCAVYDLRGNTVLTICKPVDFIVASADRKTMRVVGKTTKEMVKGAEQRELRSNIDYRRDFNQREANAHIKEKSARARRIESKKGHIKSDYSDSYENE